MLGLFVAGIVVISLAEAHGSPALHAAGLHGPNLEGKEQRFGTDGSSLFMATGTASGDGAVNGALESLTGLGALVPMANMMTGEVVFGGPGAGLYSMLLLLLLAVFIAGLMVGRTPVYLGKKIQIREVKLAILGSLAVPMLVLAITAFAVVSDLGRASIHASGPHGFAESLYAYVSQGYNNGSAFAGYTGFVQPNAPGNAGSHGVTFADLAGGVVMLLGRFVPIVVVLALAGSLSERRSAPAGLGTLRTDSVSFGLFLGAFVVVSVLLTFLAALFSAPVVEALTGACF
jgi:K+-transporting ATPase ATPase A chain